MRWLETLRMQIQMLFNRGREAQRLNAELQYHLDRQIAENIDAGMSPDEARYAALRTFGNPTVLREQARSTWSWNALELLLYDVRYGIRTLARAPGFATVAILVMALGIGANVALFTVVRSVLLKPLPFNDPDQLMMLYESHVGDDAPYINVSGGAFAEWRKQNRSFTDMALMGESEFNLAGAERQLPENVHGLSCTWNLFSLLGVRPALGRDFTAADDRRSATGTIILSWGLWKRRFGGDPGVVNQTIYLNRTPYVVIGVMPAWFSFPGVSTQMWTPVYHDKPEQWMTSLGNHAFQAIGRLRASVTPAEGVAELSLISHRLHDAHLDNPFVGKGADIRPLLESMVGDIRRPLYVFLAATLCVLLIACLNVGNLLLVRAAARRRELAIRTALGGGRLRLLRERLVECFLLCTIGGSLGMILAAGALTWLVHERPGMARVEAIHVDGVVAAFTIGLIALCALFAATISSLKTPDGALLANLQDAARNSSTGQSRARLHKTMLAMQVGLTVVLLVGAGLLLKSYERLRSSDLGCTTKNVLTMRIDLFGAKYREPSQLANFYQALLDRVRALPGIEAAGFVQAVPGQGYWTDDTFTIVEHPPLPQGQGQFAINRWADPGYFAAMGIPILRGHSFDPGRRLDQANQTVISSSFAKRYFPNEDPIGKHLRFDERTYEIVGIVGDTRYAVSEDPLPIQYYPLYAGYLNNAMLVVRSGREVDQFALPVQKIVQEIDHDLPVSDVLTMDEVLSRSTLDASFNATLLLGFALLSLSLAGVGLFGVLSYIVAQRTSEIGIRMALGAQREQVLRNVLLDGFRPALFGLAFGLAASAAAVRLIRSMLYETRPLDPTVFGVVATTLILVAALACIIPAWRASRLDPMQALRME